jgi:hypothetical protein
VKFVRYESIVAGFGFSPDRNESNLLKKVLFLLVLKSDQRSSFYSLQNALFL